MLLICCSNHKRVRQRTFLIYGEQNLILYFDQHDSLDGFVMHSDKQDTSINLQSGTAYDTILVPHVGVFGVKFGDSSARVLEVLGDPTTKKKPSLKVGTDQYELFIWQNDDTTLIITFCEDTVIMFTDYLRPIILPFGLKWRVHINTVRKTMGEPRTEGKGVSIHPAYWKP